MVPLKVRKKDKKLSNLAPAIRVMVDEVEKLIESRRGPGFRVDHRINLYLGDKQRYANNPRSGKMYIQFDGEAFDEDDPYGEIRNLYISGVLHEIGHSYLKIENSMRRAKESIASEALANLFAYVMLDEIVPLLGPDSPIVKNGYVEKEKEWFRTLFGGGQPLPCHMEVARFLSRSAGSEKLLGMIRLFHLRHRTFKEFMDIVLSVMGESEHGRLVSAFASFALEEYGKKYGRKP